MRPNKPDYILIFAIFALVIFGLVALSSASVVISQDTFGENYYFLKHQLLYGLSIGLVGFFCARELIISFGKKFLFLY